MAEVNVPENRVLTGSEFVDFKTYQPQGSEQEVEAKLLENVKQTKRQDLNLQTSHGFLVHNMMTEDECKFYIDESESKGYVKIDKEFPTDYRNNLRYIGKNQQLSKILWKRLEQHFKLEEIEGVMPYGFDQEGIWIPLELDDCFTFGRYEPGGRFKPHLDAVYASDPHKRSIYTMQVYLNDEYKGGKTNFYLPANPLKVDEHVLTESVQPRTGTALIFNHDTLHEGAEVLEGRKYIIRVDMMFIRLHKGLEVNEQQKQDMEVARKLFFEADSLEKDKGDLVSAISTYVKAQMMLAEYPSIPNSQQPAQSTAKTIVPAPPKAITDIPEYILFDILGTLSVKDIAKFRSMNKHFFKVCTKNALWKKVYIKYFTYNAFKFEEPNVEQSIAKAEKKPSGLGSLIQRFMKINLIPGDSKCWYLTVSNIYNLINGKSLFIDFGSYYVKYCTFMSSYQTEISKASLHYNYSPHYVMSSMDRETWSVGRSAYGSSVQKPVVNGQFDTDRLSATYEIIRSIMLSGTSTKLPISSPVYIALGPKQNQVSFLKSLRKRLYSTVFVTKDAGLCVLQSHGLISGTVVMLSHELSYVSCYINGKMIGFTEFPVSGKEIAKITYQRAQEYGVKSFIKNSELTEKHFEHCKVSMDFKADTTKGSIADSIYFIPPEIIFDPSVGAIKSHGIVEATLLAINSQGKEEYIPQLSHVVISGGNSCWKNFKERFTRDITAINSEITVYASNDRLYDTLAGLKIDHSLTKSPHNMEKITN